jgi:hypothetical protein
LGVPAPGRDALLNNQHDTPELEVIVMKPLVAAEG